MKTVIILFVIINHTFGQSNDSTIRYFFSYSKGFTKRDFNKHLRSEYIEFTPALDGNFNIVRYEHDSKSFKWNKNQSFAKKAFPSIRPKITLPTISKTKFLKLFSELDTNRENFNQIFLKENFGILSKEKIIEISKQANLYWKIESLESEKKFEKVIKQHYIDISNFNYLEEMLASTLNHQKNIVNRFPYKEEWDYINIVKTDGIEAKIYKLDVSDVPFHPVYRDVIENKFSSKNYNLEIYKILYQMLPEDSYIRDIFDFNKMYVTWYLTNKMKID